MGHKSLLFSEFYRYSTGFFNPNSPNFPFVDCMDALIEKKQQRGTGHHGGLEMVSE